MKAIGYGNGRTVVRGGLRSGVRAAAYCPRCGSPMTGGICDNCGFPVTRRETNSGSKCTVTELKG